MKQAILLHGTGGSDKDYFWFEDTKKFLESKGYQVWWPLLPSTDRPELEETFSFVAENMPEVDGESVIIGHSSACPLILALLERRGIRVKRVILVAGFYQSIDEEGFSELMLQKTGYDWEKIKNSADEFVMINSDNDPWGCDDKQARPVAQKLGAAFILAKEQGHMGSGTFHQPYREHQMVKSISTD